MNYPKYPVFPCNKMHYIGKALCLEFISVLYLSLCLLLLLSVAYFCCSLLPTFIVVCYLLLLQFVAYFCCSLMPTFFAVSCLLFVAGCWLLFIIGCYLLFVGVRLGYWSTFCSWENVKKNWLIFDMSAMERGGSCWSWSAIPRPTRRIFRE